MKTDGSARVKITPQRIIDISSVSPDGRWVVAGSPIPNEERTAEIKAFAIDGTAVTSLCVVHCNLNWDMSGKMGFLNFPEHPETSYELPVMRDSGLPQSLPIGRARIEGISNSKSITVIPGYVESALNPSVYAYTRRNTRRNLYRIQLP